MKFPFFVNYYFIFVPSIFCNTYHFLLIPIKLLIVNILCILIYYYLWSEFTLGKYRVYMYVMNHLSLSMCLGVAIA